MFVSQMAKKYHPDTNKDDPQAKEKFAQLAEAYEVYSPKFPFPVPVWRHLDLKYVNLSPRRSWVMKSKGSSTIRTAQRALTPVRPEEGSTTGADRPAALIRRSSSARSLGNSLVAGAMGISMPYLITPRRFESINEERNEFLRSHLVLHLKTWLLFSFGIQYIMELTFTQAAKGVNKEISVNIDAACQDCNGKGHEPGSKVQRCPACSGSGMVSAPPALGSFRASLRCISEHACRHPCRRPWPRVRLSCAPLAVSAAAKERSSPTPVGRAVGGARPNRRRRWWFLYLLVSLCFLTMQWLLWLDILLFREKIS